MSAQQLHDKMLSADVSVQQRLLEEQKRFRQQQQQRTKNIQRPRSQSSCLSEVAAACEDISPCCYVCVDRRTIASDFERETEQQKREMYFCACGKSRQHPLKAAPHKTTNADAFLIDSQIVGVADGVGSVETEGYDPALLPVELLTQCSLLFRLRQQNAALFDTESETTWTSSGGPPEGFDLECFPLHILARAHASCVSLGSTTCVLGMLDCRRRRLYTVNVGDSQLLLLRRFSSSPPLRKKTITVEGGAETTTVSKSVQGGRTGAPGPVLSLLPPQTKIPTKQEASRTGGATVVKRALEAAVARAAETTAGEPVITPEGRQGTSGRKVQITGERRLASDIGPTAVASSNFAGAAGGGSLATEATGREGLPPQEDNRGVDETGPLQSAAVVEAILQPAEKSPPAKYVVAARNSVVAAVEETDSRWKQGQQRQPTRNAERAEVSKRHEFGSWGYATEEERPLQATEKDASGWFGRDGERIRDKQEDSVHSLEEGKQLQESDMEVGDRYKVVYRTEVQQHFFNCPYQLTRMPDVDCSEEAVLRRTQASADLGYCDVKGGDIIVLGSDGLFDNLFEDEIVAVINAFCCRGSSSSKETGTVPAADPALIADQLLNMALAAAAGDRVEVGKHENGPRRSSCCGCNHSTPFSQAAYEELGRRIEGGKPDDTTVVVAFVVETQRQEVSRWQKQKQAQQSQKRCGCVESSVVSGAAECRESYSMCRAAADVGREPAAVADARQRTDNPAPDRAVVCTQGSHPGLAAATGEKNPAGKTGATATFATETAASVPVAVAGVGIEGGSYAADFAKRRATTFSIEEMSTSVSEEKPQTSIANPGKPTLTSSIAVHGRYRSTSLSKTPECSGSDCETTFFRSEQVDSEDTVTTSLRRSPNSSRAGLNKADQIVKCSKKFSQSDFRKGGDGGISAHCARVEKRDSSTDIQQKMRDIKQPHVLRKETSASGGPQFEAARAGMVCMPTTLADTTLGEQQERHEQERLAADAEKSVATSHSITTPTTTGNITRQAAILQRLPAIRGWWLFRQLQADSHLTLVMRAAPTSRSQVTKMPDIRNKTESRQMHRSARPLGVTPSHRKHGKNDGFGVDLHPPTDQETAATRASTLDKQHRQMQTRGAAAVLDSLPKPSTTGAAVCAAAKSPDGKSLEGNRFCAAPPRTANTAVAATRASKFSPDEGVDAALSACASFRITQNATGYSLLPHCSNGEGEEPTVAPRSLPSPPSSDSSTRCGPKYTCQAPPAGPAIALTTPAPVAGGIPLGVGGTYPTAGGVSRRHNPVSVSAILASSRRSFPPIHAASLTSLRVYPQATCLQQIYAAEKRQALTPAAAAAAVGAGTSPACVAAVHMKILDRRGC